MGSDPVSATCLSIRRHNHLPRILDLYSTPPKKNNHPASCERVAGRPTAAVLYAFPDLSMTRDGSFAGGLVSSAISLIAPAIWLKAPIRCLALSRKGRDSGFLCLPRASQAQATTYRFSCSVNFARTSNDSLHTTFPRTFSSPALSSSKAGFSSMTSEMTGAARSPVCSRQARHFCEK